MWVEDEGGGGVMPGVRQVWVVYVRLVGGEGGGVRSWERYTVGAGWCMGR